MSSSATEQYEGKSKSVVVEELLQNGMEVSIPYSCISSSPDGRLVIMGGQDIVRIVSLKPSGLKEVRSIRISQYFHAHANQAQAQSLGVGKTSEKFRDIFEQNTPSSISINISDVSWSMCQTLDTDDDILNIADSASFPDIGASIRRDGKKMTGESTQDFNNFSKDDPFGAIFSMPGDLRMADDSLIAAAGSNGVVLVWRACDLLRGMSMSDTASHKHHKAADVSNSKQYYGNHQQIGGTIGYPEAALVEHSKAVKVAFHPRLPGLLLTASLDGTAKLWERVANVDTNHNNQGSNNKWSWLGALSTSQFNNAAAQSFSWKIKSVFKPNCGPIRDVKWNLFNDDLFAMVTNTGFLVVYHTVVNHRPTLRIAAHAREATTLDWHPTKPYMIATGGVDMKVKVFDLEADLSFLYTTSPNTNSTEGLDHSYHGSSSSAGDNAFLNRSTHGYTISGSMRTFQEGGVVKKLGQMRTSRGIPKHIHELSISAQVEKVQWRPPQNSICATERSRSLLASPTPTDHHEAMLAVCTNAFGPRGGSGKVYLWSTIQPFIPLCIVDGHKEKSVADFIWLDTPDIEEDQASPPRSMGSKSRQSPSIHLSSKRNRTHKSLDEDGYSQRLSGTWQHILTVGKDGRCLVQSLCRGERPISSVPPSAFAIAELSPFQKGFGSLQVIAVHQNVPAGKKNEYALCGFRRDENTARAPGIFKEDSSDNDEGGESKFQWNPELGGLKEQRTNLSLTFSTTDSGDLKEVMRKLDNTKVGIAPEVVHLSRFADMYKLRRDAGSRTKASICRHNSKVAGNLNCTTLSRMWSMLASLLEGSRSSEILSDFAPQNGFPSNALSFALLPTLKSLLLERADAGDVQTCVVICEVMEVIPNPIKNSSGNSRKASNSLAVPGLDLILVRQWYLSYIELLQQMCLFSHATNLIRLCHDPEISKLNQQSTTFHESCPTCFKPLQGGSRICRSCRQKIGNCFLCQQPVKGVFVWCPGCGHGGHLEHALEWFGGVDNKLRQMCPTGCGHRCNNLIQLAESTKMMCQEATKSK